MRTMPNTTHPQCFLIFLLNIFQQVVGGLALISLLLYSFSTWTSGVTVIPLFNTSLCGPRKQFVKFISIMYNVDTVIILIIPFLAIFVMNIRIAIKVVQLYRDRKHLALQHCYSSTERQQYSMVANKSSQSHLAVHENSSGHASSQSQTNPINGFADHEFTNLTEKGRAKTSKPLYTKTQVKVTKMLLLVSTAFLVLNLPRHVLRTYTFIMTCIDSNYHPSNTQIDWQKLFHFFYYLQFSINLFLYSAFGQNFRKALLHLGCRIKHKVRKCKENSCRRSSDSSSLTKSSKCEISLRQIKHTPATDCKYV